MRTISKNTAVPKYAHNPPVPAINKPATIEASIAAHGTVAFETVAGMTNLQGSTGGVPVGRPETPHKSARQLRQHVGRARGKSPRVNHTSIDKCIKTGLFVSCVDSNG